MADNMLSTRAKKLIDRSISETPKERYHQFSIPKERGFNWCRRLVIVRNSAEFSIGDVVESSGLLAGEGFLSVAAGQRLLAEDGLVAAHEGEVSCLHQGADVVSDRHAHVEYLRCKATYARQHCPMYCVVSGP